MLNETCIFPLFFFKITIIPLIVNPKKGEQKVKLTRFKDHF